MLLQVFFQNKKAGGQLFSLDFSVDQIMEMMLDWIYQQIISAISTLFTGMNALGIELFDQPWVKQIISLFTGIGWTLFAAGVVVSVFEFAIEYQNGRGDPKALALNTLKGFFAVSLFSVVPVRLYTLSVAMQYGTGSGMTGFVQIDPAKDLIGIYLRIEELKIFGQIMSTIIVIMMAYAIIKVFLASLKRGGILLIQIAIGSLYMFSVPMYGYTSPVLLYFMNFFPLCRYSVPGRRSAALMRLPLMS